jgi:CHAT domain-containing protein/Tfp pilus assembly protein PilF
LALVLVLCATIGRTVHGQPKPRPLVSKGIVVEGLSKDGEAQKAGMRPGDVLLRWIGTTRSGEIESPFDLPYLGFEQAPRGPIRMEGLRATQKRIWLLPHIPWGIATRPNITGSLLSIYVEAEDLAHVGKFTEAIQAWERAAAKAQDSRVLWLRAWFFAHAGVALFNARKMEDSDKLYRQATDAATDLGPVFRGELFRQWAGQLEFREDFARAEKYYEAELAEWKRYDAELLIAKALSELGELLLDHRGDFARAESYFLESLAISKKLAPAALQSVQSYQNLAVLYQQEGELGKAEKYYRLAVEGGRKFFPNTYYLAEILTDIGTLSLWQGNIAKAEDYQRQALGIAKNLNQPLDVANILDRFSDCRLERGDFAGAERYQKQALAVREQVGAKAPVALSLGALGRIAQRRGHLDIAEIYYHRALETSDKADPISPQRTIFLIGLADVFLARGALPEAERNYREALGAIDQLAPRSLDHAETLASLAATLRREGRLEASAEMYRQAIGDLEYQTANLGAIAETQARYRAKHTAYYREFIDLLIEQGQRSAAFEALESSRARTLFEMLRLAQVDIREGADPALLARERQLRQSLNAKSQYRIRLLTEKHAGQEIEGLDREIADIRERYQDVEADISSSSPKYAALTQPRPLRLEEIQQLLDPETVLLEYSLGEKHSYVWVVGRDRLEMRELPGRAAVESLALQLYHALTARTHKINSAPQQEVAHWAEADASAQKLGMSLSRMILTPVSALIRGKRLLVVSDGALEYIPFSALPIPSEPNLPLLLKHEIVSLPSASVLSEIRRAMVNRPRPVREVAVLADPVFDAKDERVTAGNGPAARTASSPPIQPARRSAEGPGVVRRGGFYLERLIYSRDEAEAIRALAPRNKVLVALDFDANRAAAISSELSRYRMVHFATHGLLDSGHPELSGLVLSLVDRQGKPQAGFLALEDIYNLKLPADLVVLSSCQTALGENISGEGLMGLTRGFMYAGASRVVASLWSVDDYTTSELMTDFYRAMEVERLRPAAALRKAQLAIWKHTGWQAPYYWAAFQLQGEWK